jgi:hypothetical protein
MEAWTKTIEYKDKQFLFYLDYDADDDQYVIHQIFKMKNCKADVKIQKNSEFTPAQLERTATEAQCEKLLALFKK